jgi:hypothetical protein
MSVWTCSNNNCRKQYNDPAADKLKGVCTCGQALADETKIGWKHRNPETKPAVAEQPPTPNPQANPPKPATNVAPGQPPQKPPQ